MNRTTNRTTAAPFRWKGRALWQYYLGLLLFFAALQLIARLALQVSFFRGDLNLIQTLQAHFYGLRFDLRIASICAGVPLLAGALPWLGRWLHPVNGRWFGAGAKLGWFWPLLGSLAILVWALLVYGDFGNMAYWRQRLNVSVLYLLRDFNTNSKMVWDSYPVIWLLLLIIVLMALAWKFVSWLGARVRRSAEADLPRGGLQGPGHPARSFLVNLVLVFVGLFLIFGRWSQYPLRWSDLVRIGYPPAELLAVNPVQNIADTLAYSTPQYDVSSTRQAYPLMAPWLKVDKPDAEHLNFNRVIPARAQPYFPANANVVIFIVESLSGYKTSMTGNHLNPTPFLKTLADNGWSYSRFGSAHPFTARGVYSVVMSRPDVAVGDTASRNPQAILHTSLINTWKDHQPFYFIGGSTSWANVRGLLTKAIPGVKIYEEENYQTPRVDVWGLSDRNLFYESLKVLDKHVEETHKPFFAIIQTAANHRPYTIPPDDPEFKTVTFPEKELLENGIDSGNEELNAIRLTDHSIEKFFERARKEPWFDNTVFVFLGDHGTEGDVPKYMPPWMQMKEISIINTPLIIYSPKYLKPEKFDTMGQQADLLPTLVDMSGLSAVTNGMGRSLISERPGQAGLFFSFPVGGLQTGWFDGRYFAKVNNLDFGERKRDKNGKDIVPPLRLYDLSDVSKHNIDIAAQNPEIAQRLGAHLEAYYQTARYAVMHPDASPGGK